MAKGPLQISITTGDDDGIGSEITAKALAKLGPKPGVQFYLWRSPRCPRPHLSLIGRRFHRIEVGSWPEALSLRPQESSQLVEIVSNLFPAKWFDLSARAALFGHIDAIVTAPLSKTGIVAAGYQVIGHTELLSEITGRDDLFMAFVGSQFNVLLATGHIPLARVPEALSRDRLQKAIQAALELRQVLPRGKSNKPVAILGLNPHAGERRLIGTEEDTVFADVLEMAKSKKWPVEGPIVPDSAFFKENWRRYSVFVCNYHDQGLIPFKTVHGPSDGLHITMGLPFIRTSVDHGTAKTLFGKNKANPNSMYEALVWAIRLSRMRKEANR